ncbi:hypothetical protein Cni_G06137 [Canna indica]|uniref:Chalcone--flavonone isomerase n=1 Tax=Canna indica TaxID=4628 RepID=A0AAQ3JVZ1_9LILI|nr:hypothetical protein Cni_G06137 [Canna indica]
MFISILPSALITLPALLFFHCTLSSYRIMATGVVGKAIDEKEEEQEEDKVEMAKEPRTGVSFPVKLPDGKQLNASGLRRKKILLLGIDIYAFGIYADNAGLRELLMRRFGRAPEKATSKELFDAVIDNDVGMVVRMVMVFGGLSLSLVRKNLDQGLGESIKKLNGGHKNEELINKVMGTAKDNMKLPPGSIIEITRFPGYVLQTKVKDELVSKLESELLCRAYFQMYLGDDAFDKEAKEKFGRSLFSLL